MNAKATTQEIEAQDIVEDMKTELALPTNAVTPCTPEAHAQVVSANRKLLRGQIWIIRHMDTKNGNGNGHNAKLELGPLKISGITATVLTRLTLVGGVGYIVAKMHGWL